MTDHTELKKLAEAATPGEWEIVIAGDIPKPVIAVDGVSLFTVAEAYGRGFGAIYEEADAAFIAAANPAAVMELIADYEEARQALKEVGEALAPVAGLDCQGSYATMIEQLRQQIAECRTKTLEEAAKVCDGLAHQDWCVDVRHAASEIRALIEK